MVFARTHAALLVALGLGLAGCNSVAQSGDACVAPFLAFESTFVGFHDWPHSAVATPSPNLPSVDAGGVLSDGGIHALPETEYWNQSPPHGSAAFPQGTIIVKETDAPDPSQRQVFAMAKRGCDYNSSGAVNWEFFELTNLADGGIKEDWYGYGPKDPTMDLYGGNPAVCNDCHEKAAANDYVWSAALQLSNF